MTRGGPAIETRRLTKRYGDVRRIESRRIVDEAIERLGLTPYARRCAAHLSSGNLQRLGLAKALLHRPSLLILDEPGNALDPAGQVEIRQLLRDLADAHGATVFFSSHSIGEVARIANRVGILHRGRLLEDLGISELATRARRTLRLSARDLDAAKGRSPRRGIASKPSGRTICC